MENNDNNLNKNNRSNDNHIDKNEEKDWKKKVLPFVTKNRRYFMAGVLFLLFIAVLAIGQNSEQGKKPESGNKVKKEETKKDEGFKKTEDKKIIGLIKSYYESYAEGNVKALARIAAPISEHEKEYIKIFSKYVDKYDVLDCYAQKRAKEDSYFVSVHMGIHFKETKTVAQGLDFFYVETMEDGTLYVNNLYSQFNMQVEEYSMDETVTNEIKEFEQQDAVIELQGKIQGEYDKAIKGDKKLSKLVQSTVQKEISEWLSKTPIEQYQEAPEIVLAAADTEKDNPEEDKDRNKDKKDDEEDTEPKPDADKDKDDKEVKKATTKDKVNLRKRATVDSAVLATIPKGKKLEIVGTSEDGKWTKLKYKGKTGYIRNMYLKLSKKSDDNGENKVNYLEKGDKIYLTSTVNVRASMSKTSRKVGTAYVGDKVTVVMSYEEGWTKVKWKNKSGYILTSLLLE